MKGWLSLMKDFWRVRTKESAVCREMNSGKTQNRILFDTGSADGLGESAVNLRSSFPSNEFAIVTGHDVTWLYGKIQTVVPKCQWVLICQCSPKRNAAVVFIGASGLLLPIHIIAPLTSWPENNSCLTSQSTLSNHIDIDGENTIVQSEAPKHIFPLMIRRKSMRGDLSSTVPSTRSLSTIARDSCSVLVCDVSACLQAAM